MSTFTVNLVDGKVPVSDGEEYPINIYDWILNPPPTHACEYVWGLDAAKQLRRIPMGLFRSASSKIGAVYNTQKSDEYCIRTAASGTVGLGASGELWIGNGWTPTPTSIKMWCSGHFYLYPAAFFSVSGHIRTIPSLGGNNMYADSFVQWSSRAGKKDITDIPNAKALLDGVKPKKYKVAGKTYLGAIAEDVPGDVYEEVENADDSTKKDKGVSLSNTLWILVDVVKQLITRVEKLEKQKVKA